MFDRVAGRYDLVNKVMTLGLDAAWRRRTLELLGLAPGERVLDVACGTGDLTRGLRAAAMNPVGLDFSAGMLAAARVRAPLVRADAAAIPFAPASFDGAVSGFALRNLVDLDAVFAELARVLRPLGRLALLEVGEPRHAVVRAGHHLYFDHVVPRIGALLSDGPAYRYLPRSVAYLPPTDELLQRVARAGFGDVVHHRLFPGAAQVVTATRLGPTPLRPAHR